MTKADLVEKVATQVNLTKKDTEVVIDTIFDSISQALALKNDAKNDAKVELRGFGSFRVRRRRARQGRNPQTGNPVQVPAKRVPYFKPGKELKALVDS